ncbi:DUF3108 domain-containing protein [Sinisalibacter aestuarii]|uniref:DUF3108 domain-containing protein n=1 Tax=Sinisalibacter aestuarii TaxID=2949426 RepID=A0ABQ5LVE1_9RHOB|nr:DUF3108 domain-containing protein [Sinisalibacter aestuarii]GKY88256.1 hypothetical protein STA1M1_21250 [Sinisalibacter aestuarii]
MLEIVQKWFAGFALALGLAVPAAAENLSATFGVRLYGAPVGRMVVASNSNGSSYAAKGEFRTTGLAGLLARVRFTMSARGAGEVPRMRSHSYSEDLDTGYRTSSANLAFSSSDARIDPLTALLAALVDRPASTGCAFDGQTFDGERSMRVRIRKASESDEGITCTGQLTRVQGYTAEEMAQATGFPFSIEFRRAGDTLVAERADVKTIHGQVALVRR